ncbi:MAG: hypothetical protein M3384_22310 [Acidobacteriota bacterium]|nr:hypothetical protein [Acidobacteriota bacterium]
MTFEETPPAVAPQSNTIGEAWANLLRDPAQFIRYWNYKGAIMSGVMRAPIFLVTYLVGKESLKLALGAALVQFIFRFFFAGVTGAMIQSFRRVEPAWKALFTILLFVPLISHVFEFLVQAGFAYVTATNDHTDEAVVRSICFSIISALFTLFIMRRNVMIVGEEESKSLFNDLARIPVLIFHFCAFIPNEISSLMRRGAFITAGLCIAGFAVFSQMLCWAVTNKAFWTYGGGKSFPLLKFWGIDGTILMILAISLSTFVFNQKRKRNQQQQNTLS